MSNGKPGTTGGSAGRSRRRGGTRPNPAPNPPAERTAPSSPPAPRLDGPPGVVLERLRERIHDVVREIDALRQENLRLNQQITVLQEAMEGEASPALLRLDESPEALRTKIEGFVQALDAYLDEADH